MSFASITHHIVQLGGAKGHVAAAKHVNILKHRACVGEPSPEADGPAGISQLPTDDGCDRDWKSIGAVTEEAPLSFMPDLRDNMHAWARSGGIRTTCMIPTIHHSRPEPHTHLHKALVRYITAPRSTTTRRTSPSLRPPGTYTWGVNACTCMRVFAHERGWWCWERRGACKCVCEREEHERDHLGRACM
jgi:hypothetical protein